MSALVPDGLDLDDLERGSVLIFDTDCVLCSRWVHFVLARERRPGLVFVSAWSTTGQAVARRHGMDPSDLDRTYLFVENGRAFVRSDATIALFAHLRAPWRWLGALAVIPQSLRDRVYGWVARNRHGWFGRKHQCFAPPPAERRRFIQD